jgi:hypothetical protein
MGLYALLPPTAGTPPVELYFVLDFYADVNAIL